MRLDLLLNSLDLFIKDYMDIVKILLIEFNNNYTGKDKTKLNRNFESMLNMLILINKFNILLKNKRSVQDLITIFNKINLNEYEYYLYELDSYYSHIDMNLYKFCVEYFNYLKNIIKCIKKFCIEITLCMNELKEIKENIDKPKSISLSLSSSSSNEYFKNTLNLSAIKKHSLSFNKDDIINEITSVLIKDKKKLNEIMNEFVQLELINEDSVLKTKDEIKGILEYQTDDVLKIIKLKIITKYELIDEIIIIFLLNLLKIDIKKILKIKKEIRVLDEFLNTNTTYDSFLNSKDIITELLRTQSVENIIKYKKIIIDIFSFVSLSNDIKKNEIIDNIVKSLFEIQINSIFRIIKNIISSNYIQKSNSNVEDNIILEIIKKVFETEPNDRIRTIKNIILTYYIKKENSNSNEENISNIIQEVIKKRNNTIIRNIRNELNMNRLYKLENFLHENDYLNLLTSVDEITNILRFEENNNLKKINKIILSYKNIYNKNENDIYLKNIYEFLNSSKYLFMYDVNNIYYVVDEPNSIIFDITNSKLQNVKSVLNIIKYKSFTSDGDNFNYDINNFKIKFEYYKKDINKINDYDDIKDLIKIYELYSKIVSNNLTDIKIKENVKEILTIYNSYIFIKSMNYQVYDNLIKQRFKELNEYYKFDYEIENLEDLYLYKNYINVIIKLYEFLLSIKDNFNLIHSTINKIKNKIDLYKKIDKKLMKILFDKLNKINKNKNINKIFITYKDIYKYLDTFV